MPRIGRDFSQTPVDYDRQERALFQTTIRDIRDPVTGLQDAKAWIEELTAGNCLNLAQDRRLRSRTD